MKKSLAASMIAGIMLFSTACGTEEQAPTALPIESTTTSITVGTSLPNPTTMLTEPSEIPTESETTPSITVAPTSPPLDLLNIYAPVIENCRNIEHFNEKGYSTEELDRIDTYQLIGGYDLVMSDLGYALIDLDHDGIEELIVGCPSENVFGANGGEIVIALFGIQDGEPIKIFQSWNRNRHYLYTNDFICQQGSNGAANSVSEILRLENNELVTTKRLWSNGIDADQNLLTYYSDDGNFEENESTKISLDQYYELNDEILSHQIPLPPLTPVS